MIAHIAVPFLVLLVMKTCFANRRPIIVTQRSAVLLQPDSSTRPSKSQSFKGRIHISEFTDPDTGLNPFVDLPEGQTGAFGRGTVDQARPFPHPIPAEFESNVMEGSAEDGPHTRQRVVQTHPRWPHKGWHMDRTQNVDIRRQQLETDNRQKMTFSKDVTDRTTPNSVDEIFTDEPLASDRTFSPTEDNEVTTSDVITTSSSTDDVRSVTSNEKKSVTSSAAMLILSASLAGMFLVGLVSFFVFCWKKRNRNTNDVTQCAKKTESHQDVEQNNKGNESLCGK